MIEVVAVAYVVVFAFVAELRFVAVVVVVVVVASYVSSCDVNQYYTSRLHSLLSVLSIAAHAGFTGDTSEECIVI